MKLISLKNILKNKDSVIIIIIISFVFVIYGNTINNGYSLDDEIVVYNNPQIEKGIKGIPEIFTTHYSTLSEQKYDYRPVVKTTFAIEYSIFGNSPHLSHLVNILLYILLSISVFYLLKRILRDYNEYLGFFILFLFVAHPLHTEVVASLKNRDEILCMLGNICAVIMFIRYADFGKLKYLIYGFFFFLFGFLSKLNSLTFLLIIPVFLYFFTHASYKRIFIVFIMTILTLSIYYIIQKYMLDDSFREKQFVENPFLENRNISTRFSLMFSSLFFYLKKLIYPHPLLFYYGYNTMPILKLTNPLIIFSAIFHIGIFIYSLLTFKKKKLLSFSILFYLISLSMFSNFIRPVMGIVGERFAFMASLGFFIALSYFIFKLFKIPVHSNSAFNKTIIFKTLIIQIIIIIPCSAITITRNTDWKDHITLYKHDIKYLQNSAKANDLYASTLLDGVYDNYAKSGNSVSYVNTVTEVIKYYDQSLKIYNDNKKIHNNLGMIYLSFINDTEKSMFHLKKALSLDPDYAKALFNTGMCFKTKNNTDSSIVYFEKAVKNDSLYIDAMSELSKLYFNKGRFAEALALNEKIANTDPSIELPYVNMGNFYILSGDTLKGLEYAEEAIKRNPENKMLIKKISELYKFIGNEEKSYFYNNLWIKKQ